MTTTPDSLSLNHEFYGLHPNFTVAKRRAETGMRRGYADEDAAPLRQQLPRYADVVEKIEVHVASVSSPDPDLVKNATLGRRLVTEAQEVLRRYDAAQ